MQHVELLVLLPQRADVGDLVAALLEAVAPYLRELIAPLRLGKLAGVPRTRVSASALYKRLAVLPHTVFLALLRHASVALRTASPARRSIPPGSTRSWAPSGNKTAVAGRAPRSTSARASCARTAR